ncbi:hypothetical protein KAR48_11120 [bacterium]|nr:hypothetical protein [bacterium]
MILYKIILILNEGLIFGLFAMGIYVAFQWLKFPDLTPDGSFIFGACIYVKFSMLGMPPYFTLFITILGGIIAGFFTAFLNKNIKIPTFVSGLLTSTGLYSITWLILGKPNQFLDPIFTLLGDITGIKSAYALLSYLFVFICIIVTLLKIFADSIWGLKLRAIGENNLLARDLGSNDIYYTYIGLGIANGLVAFSGAMFAQRSYSVDINMGFGQTIIGLISMILGLLLCQGKRSIHYILPCVVFGAVLHKLVIFLTLEAGLPAESFRMLSTIFFVILFILLKSTGIDFLKGLKWT